MADCSAMKSFLEEKNDLHYSTFSKDSQKPMKAVIQHVSSDTPAEGISDSLKNCPQRYLSKADEGPSHYSTST
jgi:hypothetical protein